MIKALKVVMIIYAVIGILFGLGFIILPDQMNDLFNIGTYPDIMKYPITLLATTWIVMGVFFIIAARDVITNILWVKLAVAHALVDALVAFYSMMRGYGDFSQLGVPIILHVVFAALLLIFYPWRPKETAA